MAVNEEVKSWKQTIYQKLKERNRVQYDTFAGLIHSHNKLFETVGSLKQANLQLSVENQKLKQENLELKILSESGDGTGAGGKASAEKIQALEQKIYKLQEELTEVHKKRGENAQQIIEMNNTLQEKEKELQHLHEKVVDSQTNENAMKAALKGLEATIMELEGTNQMLKDEQQALQMAFVSLEEKFRKAQDENNELVTRWMHLKARDADKMNAENDFALRKRQAKLQKELAEAAREQVNVQQGADVIPGESMARPVFCLSVSIPSKPLHKVDAHDSEVNAIKWSTSGRLFATGGNDRKLKLWDVRNSRIESHGILIGSNAGIMSLDFDTQEELVLGGSNDFASRVWSISDQRLRHTLTGHSGRVYAAKFLGDASKVVSGSHDRTIKIWDLREKACIKTIFAGSSCNDLVTSDGLASNIISGHFDKRIRFWDTRSDRSANEILLNGRVTSLDLSPDRNYLLSCSRDDSLKLIDLRMNQVIGTFCDDNFRVGYDYTRAVFSPDGDYVMAGSSDGSLHIWNISKNKVEKVLREHSNGIIACSWHPTGSMIVTCDKQKKVILWSDF